MNLTNLLIAVMYVESSGNLTAVGDGGKSFGPLQISEAYLADSNEHATRVGGLTHQRYQLFDFAASCRVFCTYIMRYAHPKRLGRTPTIRDVLRIHNGGPRGHKKESTADYPAKVAAEYKRLFETELNLDEPYEP